MDEQGVRVQGDGVDVGLGSRGHDRIALMVPF